MQDCMLALSSLFTVTTEWVGQIYAQIQRCPWIQNEGDNEIRWGSFETVFLNNMNAAIYPSKRITY
jgi:hypothetical protein